MLLGWFRRPPAASPPAAVERVTEPAGAPEPALEPLERMAEAHAPAARLSDGWLAKEQLLELEASTPDEGERVRRFSRSLPGASPADALFRYRLSRAVGLHDLELPLLPTTATEVMRLGRETRASVHDYVGVIQSDPSLASAIVRMANSSFFSAASACATLDQAIVRIGLREVEKIATIHIFRSRVFRVRGYDSLVQQLVQHGVGVSIAAQWVLCRVGQSRAEAFLGGLFHDVGKLFLLQTIGRTQQKLGWNPPPEIVHSAFTAFHAAVGEQCCRGWALPAAVVEAVGAHHDPLRAAAAPISQAVYLGNRLVHALERGDADAAICHADDPVMLAAGLSPDRLHELRGYVVREIEQVASAAPAGAVRPGPC
jgi:HD-like signal output (HDOD) protein